MPNPKRPCCRPSMSVPGHTTQETKLQKCYVTNGRMVPDASRSGGLGKVTGGDACFQSARLNASAGLALAQAQSVPPVGIPKSLL